MPESASKKPASKRAPAKKAAGEKLATEKRVAEKKGTGDEAAGENSAGDAGSATRIRVGIGGWVFEPWRETFYPDKLPKAQELAYASRQLSAIEINSTYYSTQKPATIAKWRDETPEDFMFSLKASRFTTNRRVLAEAKESVDRFVQSGITELGAKLGPIVWQFMPTKAFDADDFGAFLELLPKAVDGHTLRHVVDVRHPSFMAPDYLDLARRFKVATVFSDTDDYPSFADLTGDLVYARLMRTHSDQPTGYASAALAKWAKAAEAWRAGEVPAGLPQVADAPAASTPRDVFLFFISGAKERAPAAAMALLKKLGFTPPHTAL